MDLKGETKMNAKIKDIIVRAVKTFIQAAGAYLIAALSGADFFSGDKTKEFWMGLAVAAGAAGISAAWNAVISPAVATE